MNKDSKEDNNIYVKENKMRDYLKNFFVLARLF
jgi:hypothetical protein